VLQPPSGPVAGAVAHRPLPSPGLLGCRCQRPECCGICPPLECPGMPINCATPPWSWPKRPPWPWRRRVEQPGFWHALMRTGGFTWLVSGALQSAQCRLAAPGGAPHAMADVLALSSGCPGRFFSSCACRPPCSWPKLQQQNNSIWPAFLRQAKDWVLSGPGSRGNSPGLDQRQLRLELHPSIMTT